VRFAAFTAIGRDWGFDPLRVRARLQVNKACERALNLFRRHSLQDVTLDPNCGFFLCVFHYRFVLGIIWVHQQSLAGKSSRAISSRFGPTSTFNCEIPVTLPVGRLMLSTSPIATGSLLSFANRRAEAWWRFRETLEPDQPDGAVIALPPKLDYPSTGARASSNSLKNRCDVK
jgi:hypothetical protein